MAALEARRPVVVVGPAGIGKTALVTAAVNRLDGGSGVERALRRGAAVDFLADRPLLCLGRALGRAPLDGDDEAIVDDIATTVGDAVLFLDDLHWADDRTIALLGRLADAVTLVVALRAGTDRADRAGGALEGRAEVVELGPLPPDESLALLHDLAPALGEDDAVRLVQRAGGNPLALGVLASGGGAEGVTSLAAAVAAVSPEARRLLCRLALEDRTVELAGPGASELTRAGLVLGSDGGEVRLAGDIIGELALAATTDEERQAIHAEVAARADDPARAAAHWAAAGARDRAHRAARDGADRATSVELRADLLALAAETAPPAEQWACIRDAVDLLLDIGRTDLTRPLLALADRLEPPDELGWAEREALRASLLVSEGSLPDAARVLEPVLARADRLPPQLVCTLLGLRAGIRVFDGDVAAALADVATTRELASRTGSDAVAADLVAAGLALFGGHPAWRSEFEQVFERAQATRRPSVTFECGQALATAHFLTLDPDAGAAVCVELEKLARRHNHLGWCRRARALRAVYRTLWELAPADVVDELTVLAHAPRGDDPNPAAVLAVTEADRGEFAAAEAALALIDAASSTRASVARCWAEAEVAWLAGDLERAARAVEDGRNRVGLLDLWGPALLTTGRWAAWELGGAPGDIPEPLALLPAYRGFPAEGRGIVARAEGRPDEAAAHFAEAAAHHEHSFVRSALRCRWAAADAAAAAGRTDEAHTALVALRDRGQATSQQALLRRVDRSLRALGSQTRRTDDNAPLTARQREVLELVGLGLSTPQIAARLQLRPSTVDSHIRNARLRLGARTRREAAGRLDDR